jgi:hypothetical protein
MVPAHLVGVRILASNRHERTADSIPAAGGHDDALSDLLSEEHDLVPFRRG